MVQLLQTIGLPSSEPYDYIRTLRMAGYGLLILGPTLHYWFNFMSRILPGRDLVTTLKKMALGQTVYGPFMTVVFFSMNAALQGMIFISHCYISYWCWIYMMLSYVLRYLPSKSGRISSRRVLFLVPLLILAEWAMFFTMTWWSIGW